MGDPLRTNLRQSVISIALVCVIYISSVSVIHAANPNGTATNGEKSPESTDQLIQKLIEKLGSDSYATRIRARNQLKTYGLEAFDALREAQNHDDSEILSAARYLIKSLQVSWSKPSDPKEVREILSEYGAQSETERLGRIELLGDLDDQIGIEALSRLSRFDPSVPISRRAAMLVLKQPLGREKAGRNRLADQIESVIGENQRDSTQWLLAYANDLRNGKYSEDRWQELVRLQRKRVDSGVSPSVTSASVMQLIRVLATRALAEGARQPALALVNEHIDLVAPTTRDLAEHSGWAVQKRLYPTVITLYQRHRHAFGENAELLYLAALAYRETGESEEAEQLALAALQINPFPALAADDQAKPDEDEDSPKPAGGITDHQLQEIARAHHLIAFLLKARGCYDWSERENRAVVKHSDIESQVGVSARRQLAIMLADQLRHGEAAEFVLSIADRGKKDKLYRNTLSRWRFNAEEIRSLYQYESALALLEKNGSSPETLTEVKEKLLAAYRLYGVNIDILIRMYRLEDTSDPNWKPMVIKLIMQSQSEIAQDIGRYEARKKARPDEIFNVKLGEFYNQYAWLVANTDGDYQKALKYSLSSIEFLDDNETDQRAARLDTCARCYFSLDRIEEAIQTQQEAITLDPFSLPMKRQLVVFQAAF